MDTEAHRYDGPHAQLTFAVIGCAMEVLNALGHGLHEKAYENALVMEFGLKEIFCEQQKRFPIHYKAVLVGEFVPDLIARQAVIVDTKVIERITDLERGKMINHPRITGLKVGLIVNFKRAKLEWERVIL